MAEDHQKRAGEKGQGPRIEEFSDSGVTQEDINRFKEIDSNLL